jgi:hypothetical protein
VRTSRNQEPRLAGFGVGDWFLEVWRTRLFLFRHIAELTAIKQRGAGGPGSRGREGGTISRPG